MPARRKPTAQHEASGAFRVHPERARDRANEPKPDGPLGPPPEDFLRETPETKKLLAAWHELIDIAPPGVLTKSDRQHVKRTAQLMVICDHTTANSADRAQLRAHLADIGCNPVGRTRIHVERGAKVAGGAQEGSSQGWAALDEERSSPGGRAN